MGSRLKELARVIVAYSNGDYSAKAHITDKHDELDGVASGINMLGEELAGAAISLNEKEVLLKEIHHRVKNNLQIISSLINLQISFIKDDESILKFRDCQARIRSIALVHEKIYQTNNLSALDLGEYVLNLTNEIEVFFGQSRHPIEFILELENGIEVDLDKAILCGLIVNELLTNAYKHAFDESFDHPQIRISLLESSGVVTLSISDNGVGIKGGINEDNSSTLGMMVVFSLVNQLEGILKSNVKKGTEITITFRKNASL
ncbi:MAG: sensor histidine kinase [Flavobacteriales bacterium]|nr:sensor histidine kinase [Flavobacteriales bacterium]